MIFSHGQSEVECGLNSCTEKSYRLHEKGWFSVRQYLISKGLLQNARPAYSH